MTFTIGLPDEQATLRVHTTTLAELLHLPDGVVVTGASIDANDSCSVLLNLRGPVPAQGALVPEYDREWIRATKLRGLRQV